METINEKNFETKEVNSQDDVIDFYEKYSQHWDERFGNSESTQHFLDRRLDSFIKLLPKNSKELRALELGVGTGVYIKKASSLFREILAVDGSKGMIEQLNIKIKKLQLNNVSTMVSDVCSLQQLESNSFDLVYYFGLIEHIIEVDSFLGETSRLLKPGGHVIGVTPNSSSPWYRIRRIVRSTGNHCESDKYYNEQALRDLFESRGFSNGKFEHWGAVPAGLSSNFSYKLLSLVEPMVEKSPLNKLLGGLTFKFQKV